MNGIMWDLNKEWNEASLVFDCLFGERWWGVVYSVWTFGEM